MNTNYLNLLYNINNFHTLSSSDLQQQLKLDNFTNSYISIINLFFHSNISITNYEQLKQYITDISNQYFSINSQFTAEEKEWLIFFIILKVQKESDLNIPFLIQDYESLPDLNSNNLFV